MAIGNNMAHSNQRRPGNRHMVTNQAVPTPINYTVVAGDTLQLIAQRFLPEAETLADFLVRIGNLNDISVSAILQTGQVLLIPGPQ